MATAANVFRDYETDGVPSSGAKKPKKSEIRQLLGGYESIINAFLSNGGLIYASKASLDADLAHAANSMAWVLGDATVANNGIYRKVGGSGTGSWTRVSDLPFSFIVASDVGDGTANDIQATTSIPVSGSALVWMNVFEANTSSPVTVSFNGGSALTVKTNTGNNVAAGGLVAGMIVLGIVSGGTFRLVSDQASSAIVAAAEAAQVAAEAARDQAVAAVNKTVRVDIVQSFTQPEKDQGHVNLGLDAKYLRITSDPLKEFRRLGMVPNDLASAASNAALLNTALGEIPATGGGLLVNFGNFYIADISAMPTNRPLSVRGQGRGASIITPTQTTGTFLEFSQADYTDTVHFSDFVMQFETAALCRAMSITYPAADATNNQMPHRVSGMNVDIRGLNAALHGPKSGIDLINVTGAEFYGVNINGRQDNTLVGENQFFSNEYAWKSSAPDAGTPTIQKWTNCKVFAAVNAWDVANLHEGSHWQDCEAVAVGRGVRVSLSAARPGMYIAKTHIAAFRECIIFNGVAQAQVTNNHLYIREDASVNPGRCVYIVNGNSNIISGNLMQSLSDPAISGVNGVGVELSNTNGNQVIDNDMGALMEGCKIVGTSADNTYRRGKWHDARGTGTIIEFQNTGSGTGNIRRGQELDVSNRNTSAVTVTGGAAAITVASTSTDTLEVGDDITIHFSLVVNKDASAGHIRAIVVKGGTCAINFDNNLTQLDVEQDCAASQTARIRGSAKCRVTTRGSFVASLQAFGPVSGGAVPIDGGQIQVIRR